MHFSTKKKIDKKVDVFKALEKLRETEDLLTKRQAHLENRIQQEFAAAKATCSTNRTLALQSLKKKKRLETQLRQLDGTLTTIEMQREALEDAQNNTAILITMKNAADALKKANNHLGIDKVNDIMDDIGEQQDITKEISEAISHNYYSSDVDEAELEKELEALEQEALVQELIDVGPSTRFSKTTDLPAVPSGIPNDVKKVDDEEEEDDVEEKDEDMKKLKQWAGLNS